MDNIFEDVDESVEKLKSLNFFVGEEEVFVFVRVLSRLKYMESKEWVERGMGLEKQGGKQNWDSWVKVWS